MTDAPSALDAYLEELSSRGGSDLLLTAGVAPLVRIDGELLPLPGDAMMPERLEALAHAVLPEDMRAALQRDKDVDMSFNWRGEARFRANVFHQRGSIGIALRFIPYAIPSLEELGVPPALHRFTESRQGLILVTGPTGSGKSTTLASMIDRINDRRACHILTIEDPIEYVHRHKRAAVNQREIGQDATSFARALRAALREDPDVVLIGEMRDLETIQIALTIAETGHLVLATLHTNDTSQALDRIVDVFPGDRQTQIRVQLANALGGIVYQQLLPRPEGGRVAAFEVLVATTPIRNLVKEGKTRQIRNVVSTGQGDGMMTLEASLSDLVARGVVDHDTATSRSLYPNEVLRA